MRRYTISVNREICVEDGLCCEVAPETFERDQDGHILVIEPHRDPSENVLIAARRCQMQAITLFDAETGELAWPESQD